MKTKKQLLTLLIALTVFSATSQVPNYQITSPNQCFSSGTNTTQAIVTVPVPGASSYSWSVISGTNCTGVFTGASANGTVANFFFPCCGMFTINCNAFTSGGILIPGAMPQQTVNVQCMTFTPNFSYSQQNNSTINFLNTTINSNTAIPLSYHWNFSGGNTSNQFSPSHYFGLAGNYIVTLTDSMINAPYCSASFSAAVTACSLNASWSPSPVLLGSPVVFTGTVQPSSAAPFYYWISNGSPSVIQGTNQTNATFTFTNTGIQTVTFGVASAAPTCSVAATYTFAVENPCTNISYSQGGNGQVFFSPPSNSTISPTSFTWSTNSGVFSNASSPILTHTSNGVYTVTLTMTNTLCGTVSSALQYTINTIPVCNIVPSFTFVNNGIGSISFASTSTGTTVNSTYLWNFGDGNTGSGITTSHNYTANGTYIATLTVSNGTALGCSQSTNGAVNVSAFCNLQAGFTYTSYASNFVVFSNNTSGTISSTTYTWNFGDGNTSNLFQPSHTYTSPGIYTVLLNINNNSPVPCLTSFSLSVAATSTNAFCNLNANFTVTSGSSGLINFANTSTGTTTNASYAWTFGDGNTSNLQSPSHTYTNNGLYSVKLKINNNIIPFCADSITFPISVSNINSPCNLNASFTHTVGANGQVWFSSTSTGTTLNTFYSWNFGNGFASTSINPWQAYFNGGTHVVSLKVSDGNGCSDSTTAAINVTGLPCTANSNYTLVPTGTPKFWNAIPDYPWNIVKAHWSWGDGSSDTLLYTSHLYSISATYSICLTVTVSCGATSSTCANHFIYKGAGEQMDILGVNVVQPSSQITGINEVVSIQMNDLKIIPNPNNGVFELYSQDFDGMPTLLSIYNLLGEKVFEAHQNQMNANTHLNLDHLNNGLYFIHLNSNSKNATIKILIEK